MLDPADEFQGRGAFVTGAGGGIGRATVLELARRGVVVTAADLDAAGLADTRREAAALGRDVATEIMDVTDPAQVARVVERAEAATPLQFLVTAAGVYGTGAVEKLSDAAWRRCMEVNAYGVFHVCRSALPGMVRRRSGAIVNMSSLHAQNGQAGASHYAASKAAVIGFTKSLAREKGGLNIRANCVSPGPIDTKLWRGGKTGDELARVMAQRAAAIPLGRIGQPDDVAGVIVFLLSSAAAFVTGQVIPVGGGEIMR